MNNLRHIPRAAAKLAVTLHTGALAALSTLAAAAWVGIAAPGLPLLPGATRGSSLDVGISLQSALLGIREHGGHPTVRHDRADARLLGLLDPGSRGLAVSLTRMPHSGVAGAQVVQVSDRVHNEVHRALAAAEPAQTSAGPDPTPPVIEIPVDAQPAPTAPPVAPEESPAPAPAEPAPSEPTRPSSPSSDVTASSKASPSVADSGSGGSAPVAAGPPLDGSLGRRVDDAASLDGLPADAPIASGDDSTPSDADVSQGTIGDSGTHTDANVGGNGDPGGDGDPSGNGNSVGNGSGNADAGNAGGNGNGNGSANAGGNGGSDASGSNAGGNGNSGGNGNAGGNGNGNAGGNGNGNGKNNGGH